MKDIEVRGNISRPVRMLIIAMLSLTFIIALIPLWQTGVERTAAMNIAMVQQDVDDLDAEGRALRAAIAAGLPSADENVVYRAGLSSR